MKAGCFLTLWQTSAMQQVNGPTPHPPLAFTGLVVFPVFHLLCCVGTQSRTTTMATIFSAWPPSCLSSVEGRLTQVIECSLHYHIIIVFNVPYK